MKNNFVQIKGKIPKGMEGKLYPMIDKQTVFEWIDEYMEQRDKLEGQGFTVKAIDRKNEMKLFGILLHSRYGFSGFRKKEYSINGIQKKALDKAKIKYKVMR